MSSDTGWLRDVIAHINEANASAPAIPVSDDEWHPDGPAVDCLVCGGDDLECPWPHDEPDWPADPNPTLDQLAAHFGLGEPTPEGTDRD